jgi:hypothetical protein
MRLGWKGLPGTKTLAYYENLYITAVKSFLATGLMVVSKARSLSKRGTPHRYSTLITFGLTNKYYTKEVLLNG